MRTIIMSLVCILLLTTNSQAQHFKPFNTLSYGINGNTANGAEFNLGYHRASFSCEDPFGLCYFFGWRQGYYITYAPKYKTLGATVNISYTYVLFKFGADISYLTNSPFKQPKEINDIQFSPLFGLDLIFGDITLGPCFHSYEYNAENNVSFKASLKINYPFFGMKKRATRPNVKNMFLSPRRVMNIGARAAL